MQLYRPIDARVFSCRELWLALVFTLTAVVGQPAACAAEPPQLVVVVSVDQLPANYLERFRAGFADDGLTSWLEKSGAMFVNCHHRHAFTYTAPGHAVMLTGAYPNIHGVVGNGWFDRAADASVYCVDDADARPVGSTGAKSYSPKLLLVDTLGDVLKLHSGGRSRVFGVALKDRAAILLTGQRADGAFWFEARTGRWSTSNHYAAQLPDYLAAYNDQQTARQWAGQTWELLLPADQYTQTRPDASSFEKPGYGLSPDFPHVLADAADRNYYNQLMSSPFGTDMTLEVARSVLTQENLGREGQIDLLAVNLSSNDYIGHNFGPYSLEVADATYRTDRQLADFLRFVDGHMDGRPWVFALSSDHGVAPIPQYVASLGLRAKANPLGDLKNVKDRLEQLLVGLLGEPQHEKGYVQTVESNQVYLRETAFRDDAERSRAQRVVREFLIKSDIVVAARTRDELLGGAPGDRMGQMLFRSFHPVRSGDVLYVTTPHHYYPGGSVASHGSPWRYDTHVPLCFLGAGVKPGRYTTATSPAAMAATLAELLGVPAPGAAEEDALYEAIER